MNYDDKLLRDVLNRAKRVAVVGVSMNPVRASYFVARYLGLKGFDVVPVNPVHAGETLFGKKIVASLSEIEGPVDMVDIFRRSEAVPEIVDEALEIFPDLQTICSQPCMLPGDVRSCATFVPWAVHPSGRCWTLRRGIIST